MSALCALPGFGQARAASEPVKLLESRVGLMAPVWSPDGSMLAVTTDNYAGILVANADGSGLRALGMGSHPAWLPDSRTIVYTIVRDNGENSTGSTLMSMDTATGATATLLASRSLVPLTPSVNADGTKVAFENAAEAAIYVMNIQN